MVKHSELITQLSEGLHRLLEDRRLHKELRSKLVTSLKTLVDCRGFYEKIELEDLRQEPEPQAEPAAMPADQRPSSAATAVEDQPIPDDLEDE